jgi:hypothetical protein
VWDEIVKIFKYTFGKDFSLDGDNTLSKILFEPFKILSVMLSFVDVIEE